MKGKKILLINLLEDKDYWEKIASEIGKKFI